MRREWCDACRGGSEVDGDLKACASCPRKYHAECCAGLKGAGSDWVCPHCEAGEAPAVSDPQLASEAEERQARVVSAHEQIKAASHAFFEREFRCLKPFVPAARLKQLRRGGVASTTKSGVGTAPPIGPRETFIKAELRPYQVEGVNWIISQYNGGTGGILADEMGLGKTLQTLSFIASLHAAGFPGPHLVVTPLAVLQNWANEIKRWTPQLSFIRMHGSQSERDRLLGMEKVLAGAYDIYLTTYETVLSEEAFFTERFSFHTITIDEGHRLKNESSKLCFSLSRIFTPFRLLLTGTPLQNNLNELWALMHYILPDTLDGCKHQFEQACNAEAGHLDTGVVSAARTLLESLMIRRVKAEVEKSLRPKVQYVLKVPLTNLQRQWYHLRAISTPTENRLKYQRFLEKDARTEGLVSRQQLQAKMLQLQKVINHPKCILLTLERERQAARLLQKRAEGSQYIATPAVLAPPTAAAQAMEDELRRLHGGGLIRASGKLHLLDRLLFRVRAQGSRVLLFSQYTLTLDVLSEYCAVRFGPEGRGFLRLDGSTNRIKREMDVRKFNAEGSRIPVYLISTRAGGQGINLATADVVVLYDTCWNPQVDLQAQDRAHRIGQKKQVKVFRLIAESTMEEKVLKRARQKLVLDALVIKKDGEDGLDVRAGTDGDGAEETEMARLSLDEMWSFLSHGVDKKEQDLEKESPPLTDTELDSIIATGRAVESESAALDLSDELEARQFLKDAPAAADADGAAAGAGTDGAVVQDMTISTDEEEDDEVAEKKAPRGKRYVEVAPKFAVGWDGGLALLLEAEGPTKAPFYNPTCVVKAMLDGRRYVVEKEGVSAAHTMDGDDGGNKEDLISSPKQRRSRRSSRGVSPVDPPDVANRADKVASADKSTRHKRATEIALPPKKRSVAADSGDLKSEKPSASATPKLLELTPAEQQKLTELEAEAAAMEARATAAAQPQHGVQLVNHSAAAAAASQAAQLASNFGRRRRNAAGKITRFEPSAFAPKSERVKRRKLVHDEICFLCKDGGELLQCSVCPRVYHPTVHCAGLAKDGAIPKGVWHCPWHQCWECGRKSSAAGGILFHCATCPATYCFDCAPDRYTTQRTGTTAHKKLVADLDRRGCVSTGSYMFFECDDCEAVHGAERRRKAEAQVVRECERALSQLEKRVIAIRAHVTGESTRALLEAVEVAAAQAALEVCEAWLVANNRDAPMDKNAAALPKIAQQRSALESGSGLVTGKLEARERLTGYVAQLREHAADETMKERVAEFESSKAKAAAEASDGTAAAAAQIEPGGGILEQFLRACAEAAAWLAATPKASTKQISEKQEELQKVCGDIMKACGRADTVAPTAATGPCPACGGKKKKHTCGRGRPGTSTTRRPRASAAAAAAGPPMPMSNPLAQRAVDGPEAELEQKWFSFVTQCAIAAGRNPNNLKCYTGKATIRRQLECLGDADANELLGLGTKPELSSDDRVRASAIAMTARGKMPNKDNGGRAAFTSINEIFGGGRPSSGNLAMRAASRKRSAADAAAPSGGAAAGELRYAGDLAAAPGARPSPAKKPRTSEVTEVAQDPAGAAAAVAESVAAESVAADASSKVAAHAENSGHHAPAEAATAVAEETAKETANAVVPAETATGTAAGQAAKLESSHAAAVKAEAADGLQAAACQASTQPGADDTTGELAAELTVKATPAATSAAPQTAAVALAQPQPLATEAAGAQSPIGAQIEQLKQEIQASMDAGEFGKLGPLTARIQALSQTAGNL